jgi:hypothetical protein
MYQPRVTAPVELMATGSDAERTLRQGCRPGRQGCLWPDVRITTGNPEESEGKSGSRGGNQREVQEVSRGNVRVTAVFQLDCLEMRGLCFLYATRLD